MGAVRDCLKLLSEGRTLNAQELMNCMKEIMKAEATPSQVGAFLVALRFSPVTPEVLSICAKTMLSFSLPIAVHDDIVLDIVGTGGDGLDTFNVSTAASFVVAAAGDLKVAKHGNRSSSGRCGSADLVESLGVKLDLKNDQVCELIKKHNFGFLFAQTFHPAMKSVSAIRKEIGVRTIFNMLGPLTNPARPNHMLIGVGTLELGDLYSRVLASNPDLVNKAMVVHSLEHGLDEICVSGTTKVWFVHDGVIEQKEISAADFGLQPHNVSTILGGMPADNVRTFQRILAGESASERTLIPVEDFIVMNAGAALFVAGKAADLKGGATLARELILSGRAQKLVQDYVRDSQTL
eukprot:TRINITY_DN9050_c0_g1_i1.p1 TRINITY_DN9050_c0_g1~~TRINITY_DN9050_c0_g1_i1.p1  ORF type:complete len:350 (-),score=40.36 TRINITY_DN9050_c0_g1_i1:6-1055(-)